MSKKETTTRQIGKAAFVDLADLHDKCKDRSDGAMKNFRGAMASAKDAKGVNSPMASLAMRMRRMGKDDPIKLANQLAAFDLYREYLGLDSLKAADIFEHEEKKAKPNGTGPKKVEKKAKAKANPAVEAAAERAEETSERKLN